jgi:hypothetical protein
MFLRVWPALDVDLNLERFLKEKHDLALVLFDQAYDINGNFQDSLYMAAYQRHLDAEIVSDRGTVQSHREQNRNMNITTDSVGSGISAIGLTTTDNLRTSTVPTVPSIDVHGRLNRNNIQLTHSLQNVGSTVMISQHNSLRNTSILTHQRASQISGRVTGRNSTRNIVTVTTSIGRLMRPIIDQLMSMPTFSWAYVPFLKAAFAPGELNLSHASLMILDMFWPKDSNIYLSLETISHAYEQIGNDLECNLRDEIYNKYAQQRVWYPPAEEQEVMLGDIQRYRAYHTTNQININDPINRLFNYFDNDFSTPAAINIDNCMTNLTTAIINMQQNRHEEVALPPLPPRWSEIEGIQLLRNYRNSLSVQQSSSIQSTRVRERGSIHTYVCNYNMYFIYIIRFLINQT